MTPFDPRRINWYRARVAWCARGLAVTAIGFGAYLVLKRALFAAFAGWKSVIQTWGGDIGDSNSLFRGAAMIVVGAALFVLSKTIARVVVSVPETGCPRCGHPSDPSNSQPCCPECGLRLGDA